MRDLEFALIGAGFWSQYQLAAWGEVAGARCVAICDPVLDKARDRAHQAGVSHIYTDVHEMLDQLRLDFVDIVSTVESHAPLAMLAMQHGVAAICQKPFADSLEAARALCEQSRSTKSPLLVHENWRWQAPIRRLKTILDTADLGSLVRARIDFANSFPVFDNQASLKFLQRFILTDIGTHLLDVSRFLFGEAEELYCQTRKMRSDIAGEDVATVMMRKQSGLTVTCNMSYASRWELDRFPQTMIAIEGTRGGVSLGIDYVIRVFEHNGDRCESIAIPSYDWIDPAYELVHSSIVDCHRNLLSGLRGESAAETTGEDNLRTLELVYASYESAVHHRSVGIVPFSNARE
jgi:predicted dehydrogenase